MIAAERVLVIGASGFLGRHVTDGLLRRGRSVRAFDLRIPSVTNVAPTSAHLEHFEGSIFNTADLERALDGMDTVVHLVSSTVPSSSIDNVLLEVESNVAATARLLDAMKRTGVRRIGYPSSGGTVYGASSEPHREDEALRPTCPYGLGKVLIEDMIRYFSAEHGFEHQIWRIANPYGDALKMHTSQGAVDAFLYRVATGQPIRLWGDGSATRDFVFVDDVARAVVELLSCGTWDVTVNVGTGVGESLASVIDVITRTVPLEVRVERQAGYTGPSWSVLDVTKLRALTGFTPEYDLVRGVAEAYKRLEAHRLLTG